MILSVVVIESTSTRSVLFESLKHSDFFSVNLLQIVFLIILIACIIRLYLWVRELVRLWKGKFNIPSLISEILPETAWLVFVFGMAIYYVGYAYAGTADCVVTLTLRSALSAFEMFLSKSNLIGIADNCKGSSGYMLGFAVIHALAVAVSMIFAVTCFGKRLFDYAKGIIWIYVPNKYRLNVFWGLNEKSILLAKDIYKESVGKKSGESAFKARIVFVDWPQAQEENKIGQSFSGIMGLLTYKTNAAKLLSDIKYILLRSSTSPDAIDATHSEILREINLGRLARFMRRAKRTNFFILSNNEDVNIHAAINLLSNEIGKNVDYIYCCAKLTKEVALLTESSQGKLQIIDDSRAAVMEFAMRKNEKGECLAHPINFVEINHQLGYVETEKPFTAFLIGFGTTGQEALRFLYEFSAFADSKGKKAPVDFHIFDSRIDEIKGELYQEIPALPLLEGLHEITLHPYNAETLGFLDKLHEYIDNLNYVVIATGEDERNLHIATRIYEYVLQHRQESFKKIKILVRLYESGSKYKFNRVIETCGDHYFPAMEHFGSPNDIYTKRWVVDDEEKDEAIKFYQAYCQVSKNKYRLTEERRKCEVEKELTQLLGYRRLTRVLMQDKANCKHCYTKEVLLGLRDMSGFPELPSWPIKMETKNQTEKNWHFRLVNVSICEHLRWNASHLMMGYLPMSVEEAKAISNSCNERTKKHLCITDWDKLPENPDYKEYDYMVVSTTIKQYFDKRERDND